MFGKFLPRSAPYFEYFNQQCAILEEMTALLKGIARGEKNAEESFKRITDLEIGADNIQHTVIEELSHTFITPIDREDIYAVSMTQERIIDSLKLLGARFLLFSFLHVRFPAIKMIDNMYMMARQVNHLISGLKDKREPVEAIAALHTLKEDCQMLLGVGLSELMDVQAPSAEAGFEMAKQLMIWVHLYDRIEVSVDLFGELTDTLEQVVLKYA